MPNIPLHPHHKGELEINQTLVSFTLAEKVTALNLVLSTNQNKNIKNLLLQASFVFSLNTNEACSTKFKLLSV